MSGLPGSGSSPQSRSRLFNSRKVLGGGNGHGSDHPHAGPESTAIVPHSNNNNPAAKANANALVSRPVSSPEATTGGGWDDHDANDLSSSNALALRDLKSQREAEDQERRKRTNALKAITDAVKKETAKLGVGSRFTRVPAELLLQEYLRLEPWAVLVDDDTVYTLVRHNAAVRAREELLQSIAQSKPNADTRKALSAFLTGGTEKQTDVVQQGARAFRGTKGLDITGATAVTDTSIAALAKVWYRLGW